MVKSSRIKNSFRNVYLGIVITFINTILSFINRTVLVRVFGQQVLGLNSLFTEIIAMLSLAELGVGMAIIYSLYKPINDNDYERVSQLMSLYKISYNFIAIVILFLGLGILPFIHLFLTDISFSLNYIRIIYLLFVIKSSASYLYSYKTSILNADQRQYIVNLISSIIKIVITVITVLQLILTKNYILYLVLLIIQNLLTNIVISVYVDKHYPHIKYNQMLNRKDRKIIFDNIKNVFIKRVSGVVTSSTDNILISSLVSTLQVGVYSNYQMVFSVARTLKQQFTSGVAGSIGNLAVTESPEHCSQVLYRLTFLYFVFGFFICNGLMSVVNSFIEIWLGTNYLLDRFVVYFAVLNLFIEICCDPLWQFLEVSGLFKQDRNIAILGSTINLFVSIFLGRKIGMVGILLGTLLTQVIQIILKIYILFMYNYHISAYKLILLWFKLTILFIVTSIFCICLNELVFPNLYFKFICQGCLSLFISCLMIIVVFRKDDGYKYFVHLIKSKLKVGSING